MPFPGDLSWEVRFIFWALLGATGLLSGLAIFFIARYIKKNDDHHVSMESAIRAQSQKMETHINSMKEVAETMDRTAIEIQKSNASFHHQVNQELWSINKTTSQIKSDLSQCNDKIDSMRTKTDDMMKTVTAHHKSLTLSAKAMQKQKDKLGELESAVKKMNRELVLVGQKK